MALSESRFKEILAKYPKYHSNIKKEVEDAWVESYREEYDFPEVNLDVYQRKRLEIERNRAQQWMNEYLQVYYPMKNKEPALEWYERDKEAKRPWDGYDYFIRCLIIAIIVMVVILFWPGMSFVIWLLLAATLSQTFLLWYDFLNE
jgi:hypothetical protein